MTVLLDPLERRYLDLATVDYIKDRQREGFVVTTGEDDCGC